MQRLASLTLFFIFALLLQFYADERSPIRGYSHQTSKTEGEWETKLRAIPDPQNLREYMKHLSARPHHVGSPYDKENAEWIVTRLKEWGLDAQLEIFRRTLPDAKGTAGRTGGTQKTHVQPAGASVGRRPHIRSAG